MNFTTIDHSATLWLNFDGGVVVDRLMWLASERLTWAPLYILLLWLTYRKWVVLVGYSRIYLGAHFLSQVLFGLILGAFVGGFVVWLVEKFAKRFKHSNI